MAWLRIKLLAAVALAVVMSALVYAHTPGLDGPTYSHWGWRRSPAALIYPMMLVAAAPLALGHWLHARGTLGPRGVIPLVMLSLLAMQLGYSWTFAGSFSTRPMIELVQHPMALSYFVDAARLMASPGDVADWLANYPALMPQMYLHSQEKPPGPVLYFALFIGVFGLSDTAALAAGMTVGVISTGAVPACYALVRALGGSRDAGVSAATALALAPSMAMFIPSLDPWYAMTSCGMLACWALALRRDDARWSVGFGLVLALQCFIAYNALVFGAMIVAYALLCRTGAWGGRIRRFARHSLIVMATVTACYAALWLVSGFDPIATFATALENQEKLAEQWGRPWPKTIPFDLHDFMLGANWVACLLAAFFLMIAPRGAEQATYRRAAWAGVGQIVLTAVTGLLAAETARVWAFLVPMVMLSAGAELARWPAKHRAGAYAAMWLVLAVLMQNLIEPYGIIPPLVGATQPASP